MSAEENDPGLEASGPIWARDDWVRDVLVMGVGWLVATVIAILLLLFVGPMVF